MYRITVCVPCFNSANTIEAAIQSLLSQTIQDYKCIIVDNCSSDETVQRIRSLVSNDARFTLIVNSSNNGAADSFYRLARMVQSEFMCYLSSDDYFAPEYLEAALALLASRGDAICATGKTLRFRGGNLNFMSDGTFTIDDKEAKVRMKKYLASLTDNSRFHGVYRTNAIHRVDLLMKLFAGDLAFTMLTLREGSHVEIDSIAPMVFRELPSSMVKYFPGKLLSVKSLLLLIFPARNLVSVCWRRLSKKDFIYLSGTIFKMNMRLSHSMLMSYAVSFRDYLRNLPIKC